MAAGPAVCGVYAHTISHQKHADARGAKRWKAEANLLVEKALDEERGLRVRRLGF